ncbi:hypothetical protein Cni_G09683 [Canna indica]|uniref:WW domain-containing protein n=1 Tax=Canna indica TaxID=4628 RepID=A0AAQ3K2V8_9LILI|nr:hypothetical protein Cni_G09683 [Canna indica]
MTALKPASPTPLSLSLSLSLSFSLPLSLSVALPSAMRAPNIEMIAASLRSCSLGVGGGGEDQSSSSPPHLAEISDESAGGVVTVELNSEIGLPHHWEQCLDLRSGEIYYINWETGVRTTEDPRAAVAAASALISSYYYSDEDEYSCASYIGSGDDFEDDEEEEEDGDSSSSLSSESPPRGSAAEDAAEASGGHVLVAAGCRACFMYFMVPKRVNACPKCGGGLLHLGRNGAFDGSKTAAAAAAAAAVTASSSLSSCLAVSMYSSF